MRILSTGSGSLSVQSDYGVSGVFHSFDEGGRYQDLLQKGRD